MKKLICGILLLYALAMSGCSIDSSKYSLDTLSSVTTVEYMYSNSEVVNYLDNISLTDEEMDVVLKSLISIDDERKSLKMYKNDPMLLITDLNAVRVSYDRIKQAYLDIRSVVVLNKKEYTSKELETFESFDKAVAVLDDKFNSLITSVQTNEVVNTALSVANIAIKLGVTL